MPHFSRGALAAVALLTLLICAGCQSATTPTPAPTRSPEETKASLRDVLTQPGVTFLSANTSCNCVRIGVIDDNAEQQARDYVNARGIPLDAVQFKRQRPLGFQAWDLESGIRPVKGGLRIKNEDRSLCTMFSTVFHRSLQVKGLLTNSHCTRTRFLRDGIEFFQAGGALFSGDFVAREILDPESFTLPPGSPAADPSAGPGPDRCPAGRVCRLSDAAFAQFDTSTVGIVGRLARPVDRCGDGQACGRALSGQDGGAFLQVSGTGEAGPQMTVDKIGFTTGWTFGRVEDTCADVNVANPDGTDSNVTMICQTLVGGVSDQGDSGSPVFIREPTDTGTDVVARLVGIMWGGTAGVGPQDTFVYTPLSGVESELGAFLYRE